MEWISSAGEKSVRNSLETYSIANAFDRAFPLPRSERPALDTTKEKDAQEENTPLAQDSTDTVTEGATTATPEATEKPIFTTSHTTEESSKEDPSAEGAEATAPDLPITPHRDLYFYLHRPRTTTKKPVLIPLSPSSKLVDALRGHTVLEFPTIYTLPDSSKTLLAEKETSPFILEEEYIRTVGPEDTAESEESADDTSGAPGSGVDLGDIDENKVLEVLKQDLFEPVA